jgi:uncharacterized membrane protein YedE/YeeE
MVGKAKQLYKILCQDNWNAYITGILIAVFSILMLAWARPWGAVGAVRNWGEWIIYGVGLWDKFGFGEFYDLETPAAFLTHSGSVIGIGFVGGAFVSACLGGDFAFNIPPKLEMVKAIFAGFFMGLGAAFAGGCNVGGFYNAIGNLSAHGFAMMIGLVFGAILGLKYIYWEMEHIEWGQGGGKTIELPGALKIVLGIVALGSLVYGSYSYAGNEDMVRLSGMLLIAAALGYSMQRGRWCMIQGFREPHMTGECTMAKSVALSIAILAAGIAVLKFQELRAIEHYVRGTFGWGGVVGGVIFGFGAMLAGGCGTGTLWRVGEGQIKLWIVAPVFGLSSAFFSLLFRMNNWEGMDGWMEDGITDEGILGRFVYMPDTFLGYGGTLALVFAVMAAWWITVEWNEESNKFILEM